MTHPEDDDSDLADHGTVIMDRKAASGIPRSAVNPTRPRPAPPPMGAVGPAAGSSTTPSTPPVAPPASPSALAGGLPVLPQSLSGVAPSGQPRVGDSAHKRLAALVAFGSFTVVFVIGALIMILIRLGQDSADDAPRPNTAPAKPTTMTSSRSPGK